MTYDTADDEPRVAAWRNLSTGAWLCLSLVLILVVALVALVMDRPPGPVEGPVNYIVFCRSAEQGGVGMDLTGVIDSLVLGSIPTTTELWVVVSLKPDDAAGPAYLLEVENPAGGVFTQPLPFTASAKSSVVPVHITGFEVDEPGVFEFRVLRDRKVVAARGLPISSAATSEKPATRTEVAQ